VIAPGGACGRRARVVRVVRVVRVPRVVVVVVVVVVARMMDAKPYARSRLRASSRVFVTAFARLRHRGRAFASRVFVSRALDRRARARRGVRAGRARAVVAARPTTRSDNTDQDHE
jgi:hypothetical protein